MQKNIGRFQITVQNTTLVHVGQCFADLYKRRPNHGFGQAATSGFDSFQMMLQITVRRPFQNNDQRVGVARERVQIVNDVAMVEGLQQLHFLQTLGRRLVFDVPHSYSFQSNDGVVDFTVRFVHGGKFTSADRRDHFVRRQRILRVVDRFGPVQQHLFQR